MVWTPAIMNSNEVRAWLRNEFDGEYMTGWLRTRCGTLRGYSERHMGMYLDEQIRNTRECRELLCGGQWPCHIRQVW